MPSKGTRAPSRPSLTIPCATCGRDFRVYQSQYDAGQRSCGRACKSNARQVTCIQCGGSYKSKPYLIRANATRFCSISCKNAALVIPFPDYVWAKVDKSAGDLACWPWIGGRDKDGYGVTHKDGKYAKASRVVLEIKLGRPLGDDMMACHDCPGGTDHPWCCNPSHLWEGTATQNRQDAAAKQRARENHVPAAM